MTLQQVTDWLERLELGQYAEAFRDNHIDGANLRGLDDAELGQLGVASMGHRKRLRTAIAALSDAIPPGPLADLIPRFPPRSPCLSRNTSRRPNSSASSGTSAMRRKTCCARWCSWASASCAGCGAISPPTCAATSTRSSSCRRWATGGAWLSRSPYTSPAWSPARSRRTPRRLSSRRPSRRPSTPVLDGPVGPRTVERSFLALRIQLAHGGVTRRQAARLLQHWQAPFEALWQIEPEA
jgi:hypothetical protein